MSRFGSKRYERNNDRVFCVSLSPPSSSYNDEHVLRTKSRQGLEGERTRKKLEGQGVKTSLRWVFHSGRERGKNLTHPSNNQQLSRYLETQSRGAKNQQAKHGCIELPKTRGKRLGFFPCLNAISLVFATCLWGAKWLMQDWKKSGWNYYEK